MTKVNPASPIVVQRKLSPLGNRYWYFSNSMPISMAEPIALAEAARGKVRIVTIGDRHAQPR